MSSDLFMNIIIKTDFFKFQISFKILSFGTTLMDITLIKLFQRILNGDGCICCLSQTT